jgi:threonine dehydratase
VKPPSLLGSIDAAAGVLRGVAIETPMIRSDPLSRKTGLEVHLKLESLQVTGSFKIRGAYYKLSRLSPQERARGVICSSAGNHGQGVALSAKLFQVPALVVMPEEAAFTKIKAIRGHGGEVLLYGASFEDAFRRALEIRDERGLAFVHAYDDFDVIAGQGTVGLEIVRALPQVGTVLVPIGGGGLISGVATAVKALRPKARVVGVVAAEAPGALLSFEKGERTEHPVGTTIADGIRVKRPGEITFPIIREKVDEVVEVSEEEIGDAVFALLGEHKIAVEGAGAAAVAAVIGAKARLEPPVCAIVSGGNIDLMLLTHVIERGLTIAGTYVLFATRVPDRPGSLSRLLARLAERGANVLEIEHRRTGIRNPLGSVEIEVVFEAKDPEHAAQILQHVKEAGFEVWMPGK